MDWKQVKNYPKYNPFMFEIVRHLEGMAKWEFAKRAGLSTKRYSDIENGDINPTDEEVQSILKSQTHVIGTFFQQWWETKLDISGVLARNIPIDYYRYKIFREINPQPFKVFTHPPIIPEKPEAKVLSFS